MCECESVGFVDLTVCVYCKVVFVCVCVLQIGEGVYRLLISKRECVCVCVSMCEAHPGNSAERPYSSQIH